MNLPAIKGTIILCTAMVLAGCSSSQRTSQEDIIAENSHLLINLTKVLFTAHSSIPDGDLTKHLVTYYQGDSLEQRKYRDSWLHLKFDYENKTIKSEFGGQVMIVSKNNKLSVIYTKVPTSVDCREIPNVSCVHNKVQLGGLG